MRSRFLRLALWYSVSFVWMPALLWAFVTHRVLLVPILVFVAGGCFYFGLRKHTCANCGRAMRVASAKITHCVFCGAAFTDL